MSSKSKRYAFFVTIFSLANCVTRLAISPKSALSCGFWRVKMSSVAMGAKHPGLTWFRLIMRALPFILTLSAVTAATSPSSCILFIKWMSIYAMGFVGILGRWANTAQYISSWRYRLQMGRIYARWNTAKMVGVKLGINKAHEHRIHQSMSKVLSAFPSYKRILMWLKREPKPTIGFIACVLNRNVVEYFREKFTRDGDCVIIVLGSHTKDTPLDNMWTRLVGAFTPLRAISILTSQFVGSNI